MNKSSASKLLLVVVAIIFVGLYADLFAAKKIFVHDNIIWYGSFHYYVESLAAGHFPYWNPYMMTGTYFYPNISLLGLLDPSVLVCAAVVKLAGISPLTAFIYFRLFRLFVFTAGAYYLYRHITDCPLSAVTAAGVLMFAVTPAYFNQNGMIDLVYLTPFILFFIARFFEDTAGPGRFYYLSCAVLLTGITMNIFIPAYFLFNLVFFLLALFIAGIVPVRRISACIHDRRLLLFSACAVALIVLMSAPPLMVMFKDASADGELFPILRVVQKAGFRQIVASDIGNASLSGSFTEHLGQFSSWGNMANLLYPDVFLSLPYFSAKGMLAENNQYIGILPFLLAVIGLLYHKSRYRYLAAFMALVITINMFGVSGVNGPFNVLQKAFNAVFSPLGMIDVRQSFGSYLLLYLCMLSALGLGIIFNRENLREFLGSRLGRILALIALIVAVKTGVTWFIGGKYFFASYHDLFVLCELIFFGLLLYLYQRGVLKQSALYILLIGLIFADHYLYNRYTERYVLQDSGFLYSATGRPGRKAVNEFQYFRMLLPPPNGLAFAENLDRMNCVLTYGNNHSPFSTKRYYDFLTHVPLTNQLVLSGVVYPNLGFFPTERSIIRADRRELLDFLASAEAESLSGSVFLEKAPAERASLNPVELQRLDRYPKIDWLDPSYVGNYFLPRYLEKWGPLINSLRADPGGYLATPEHAVSVSGFTPNEAVFSVRNYRDGYLLYNDGWSRYWQAFENNREIPVVPANYNSKAVFLQRGEHTIRFVFNPVHYKIGLAAYYLGLLVTACMAGFFLYRKGRLRSCVSSQQVET